MPLQRTLSPSRTMPEQIAMALGYLTRASKSFVQCSGPGLKLAMSLHVVADIYRNLGRFEEAVPALERAIVVHICLDRALAKFTGYMQLGDTFSMIGQVDRSIGFYEAGLKIQMEATGNPTQELQRLAVT